MPIIVGGIICYGYIGKISTMASFSSFVTEDHNNINCMTLVVIRGNLSVILPNSKYTRQLYLAYSVNTLAANILDSSHAFFPTRRSYLIAEYVLKLYW